MFICRTIFLSLFLIVLHGAAVQGAMVKSYSKQPQPIDCAIQKEDVQSDCANWEEILGDRQLQESIILSPLACEVVQTQNNILVTTETLPHAPQVISLQGYDWITFFTRLRAGFSKSKHGSFLDNYQVLNNGGQDILQLDKMLTKLSRTEIHQALYHDGCIMTLCYDRKRKHWSYILD